ncbi:MAG: glycosyltransferase family 2 protein [Patescibacteria group bacterium]|nr:glycosyltransferase family 2 protein [Patescibacteria group bacterium]
MITTVIPVYNEQPSLRELHAQISRVAREQNYELEFVFVDDGSTDGSWTEIERLAAEDSRVRGIRFRRNFGKAAALNAGFAEAKGDIVMTLDADLQDDPNEIPNFLAKMAENLDVVSGWKQVRHDPWHKVFPSRVFNWMVSWLTDVSLHDHNCGMKCYRREALEEIRLYGELHRFVPVLAAARGYRVGEISIQHRARQHGQSKYGVSRFVKGFLDLLTVKFLTGFGQRPQHVLGTIGLAAFILGVFGMAFLAAHWGLSRLGGDPAHFIHLHERPSLLYSVALLLLGGQLMSIGFVAELLIAYHDPTVPPYSISRRTARQTAAPPEASHPQLAEKERS